MSSFICQSDGDLAGRRRESQSGARREVELVGTYSRFGFDKISVIGLFPLTG